MTEQKTSITHGSDYPCAADGAEAALSVPARNRFDRLEWAGAFGDLGTFLPFAVGYIGVLKMDPFGLMFAFGIAMVICGIYYRTPFPVQPMKAIGGVAITQAAQTAVITPTVVIGASLVTGVIWLVLGLTGAVSRVGKIVSRPVVTGIVLGLGISFMLEGVKMMATHWLIAAAGLVGTLIFLGNRRIPAMFLLLLFGIICGAIFDPGAIRELAATPVQVKVPRFVLADLTYHDVIIGTVFLVFPQLPLTLGNAVIAVREENNSLFPDRSVTDNSVATSMGLMNVAGSIIGGVPMCHGAGGMAGHVAFGARTGGATIILGSLFLLLALFFSNSVNALFHLFPSAILGVILFLTGVQLALGAREYLKEREGRFVTLATAACALWNVGVAFLVGMAGAYCARRRVSRTCGDRA